MSLCIAACAEDPKNPPVKVSDGTSVELSVGETETFAVADFIAANGSPVTAESSDDAVATAAVAENILTITAVAAGEADVSLICGEVTVTFDVTVTSAAEPMEPVKVKDGVDFELAIGEDRVFTISEYITANGNEVTASSSDPDKVSAAVAEDALTITAGIEGEATVTLSCANISVTFQVTVYRTYTVSVDGVETQVRSGAEFTLPQAAVPEDQNFEFVAWQVGGEHKQPGEKITVNSDLVITSVMQRKAPVKIKDGTAFEVAEGAVYTIDIAEYITTYGNEAKAESADTQKVAAAVADGKLTVTAASVGETQVTLSCGDINITFSVTVYTTYTVSVDGVETQVRSGTEFTLPQASVPEDPDFEFVAWQVGGERKQPGEKITVNSDLVITSVMQRKAPVKVKDGEEIAAIVGEPYTIDVADYITTYGNEVKAESDDKQKVTATIANGTLTLTPQWAGSATVTLACGSVSVAFHVTIKAAEVAAPVFENGTIFIDLFERQSGSYEFSPTSPDDVDYDYQYSVTPDAGVSIDGDTLTFMAEETVENLVLTINVIATASVTGETVEKTASFTVTVNVTDSTPRVIEAQITVPETVDLYEGAYTIDLSANIQNAENVEAYMVNDSPVDGTSYAVTGSFTDKAQDVTLTIVAKWGGDGSISYVYSISVMDSTAYRMPNGGFEDETHGSGWSGMTGTFSDLDTYWETWQSNNDGWYYVGVDGATEELSGTETVVSPSFVVGNSGWITFKLGSMRPEAGGVLRNIYLEVVEDVADGEDVVLARVRNVDFKDPEAALRLNDYKLDLSQYKGKTVFIRAVDQEAGGDFRSLYLDAFVTWYDEEPSDDYTDLTRAYFLDQSVTIDLKDGNAATIVPIMLSEGLMNTEYTYSASVEGSGLSANGMELNATANGEYSVAVTVSLEDETIATFNVSVTVINTTPIPEFEDISRTISYDSWYNGGEPLVTEVTIEAPEGDRFSFAYEIASGVGASIEGNVLSYTPSQVSTVVFTVRVILTDKNYTVTDLPECSFTVTLVFEDNEIVLAGDDKIEQALDVNDAENKEQLTIDFSDHLIIPDGKQVAYTVELNGEPVVLNDSYYTIVFAEENLTDSAKEYVFDVTAVSGDVSLAYTLTLSLTDTYQYRIVNGGFDDGLNGWTVEATLNGEKNDAALGGISTEETYWVQNIPFNNDGKFFSGLAANAVEQAVGTLTSSVFTVGGSGWITYKLGGARNIEQVYMQIVSSDDGKTVTLPNFDWSDAADSVTVRGCTLVSYKAKLIEYGFAPGEKVYIRITDNGTGDYGLFFLDSVITYYPVGNEPDDTFRLVSKYRILNGGFETGNLTGWTLSRAEGSKGDIGTVTSQDTYWQNTDLPTTPYGKDGTYLFSFWTWEGDDQTGHQNNREGFTGTLTSSIFTLKAGATVCFLLGGGGGNPDVYLEFVNANTGEVIAKFMNTSPADAQLIRYYYQFNELSKDTECYIRVTDNATSNWGCFTLDGIEVNCATPDTEVFHEAVNQISVTEE